MFSRADASLPSVVRWLNDGTRVVVRPIDPSDGPELREGFRRLSAESRHQRFFAAIGDLSDDMVRYLTHVDGVDHVALVALIESYDCKSEVGVAVGRFIRAERRRDAAELAVTVVDDMQNRGLGRVLVDELGRAATGRGITKFRGQVLATNGGMIGLLRRRGAVLRSARYGVLDFGLDVLPPATNAPKGILAR